MIKITRKNPKNEKLLKTLSIRKITPTDLKRINYKEYGDFYIDKGDILYLVEDPNYNKLGFAIYQIYNKSIRGVFILENYQRQGIATFLYDYIEKDLNVKLKPSKILLSDGEEFWKNRLKRKNPTDKEFLKKIKITKTILGNDISYKIFYQNEFIGFTYIGKDKKSIKMISIDKEFQRKGLATFMHDYIEKDLHIKIIPSEDLTDDGEEFYKVRLKRKLK